MSNRNHQPKKAGINLLHPLGKRVFSVLGLAFSIGLGLYALDSFYLKKECDKPSSTSIHLHCFLSPISVNIGLSLITSVVTILIAELALRDEIIQQIQDIWNSRQATRYIKAFYPNETEYGQLILKSIEELQPKEPIKFLCFDRELILLGGPQNLEQLEKKIQNGCHFKILLIHPDSSLLQCMEKVGYKDGKSILSGDLKRAFSTIYSNLSNSSLPIEGSLEIRLHKDLFSPFCYFSSPQLKLIRMYFSKGDGFVFPGFDILDEKLIEETESHFDNLWAESARESQILLKITQQYKRDEIKQHFPM